MPVPLAENAKLHIHVQVVGHAEAGGGDAQDTVLDLFYKRTTVAGTFTHAAFVTAFHTAIKTKLKDCLSDQWTWLKTRTRLIDAPQEAWTETTVNEAGAVSGDAAPSFVAAVLSKRSAYRGRKFQGRCYLGPLAEDSIVGNELEAAEVTLLTTLAAAMDDVIADTTGSNWTPVILSRSTSALKMADDPPTINVTAISNVNVRSVLGRQSQRKSKVV